MNYISNNIDSLNDINLSTLFYHDDDFYQFCYDISCATASLNAVTKRHPFDDLIDVMKDPTYYIEQYGTMGRLDDPELEEWLIASVAVIVKIAIAIVVHVGDNWTDAIEKCVEAGIFDICAYDTHTVNAQDLETTYQILQTNVE